MIDASEFNDKNEWRAECAAYALDEYGRVKEGRADYDPPAHMAADPICDLMHLIKAHGEEPDEYLASARINFEAEQEGKG